MGKSKKKNRIKIIAEKAGKAAGAIKAAIKDFLVKVNPGP